MTQTRGDKNRLITPDIIAPEYLMRLTESLVLPRLASFDYRTYFENAIGNTITIKKPYYAFLTGGRELTDAQINPMVDETITLSVDKRYKGALRWNDIELTLDIDQFSERYLDPIVEQQGIAFDQDGGRALSIGGYLHDSAVGTALTQDTVPDIRAIALESGIPLDGNSFGTLNPVDSAQVQKDLSGAAGDSGKYNERLVAQNIRESFVGRLSRFMMFETNHIDDMEVLNPTGMSDGQIMGANQRGDTLLTDGWGVNNTLILKKGQIITIRGVGQTFVRSYNEIEQDGSLPTKRSTGRAMPFVIQEDVTTGAAGAATLKISPSLNDGALTTTDGEGSSVSLRAFQNVTQTPADDAVITVVGRTGVTAGTNARGFYRQNIFFHRKAFHYVPIRLNRLSSAVLEYGAVDPQTNIYVSVLQYLDGSKREETVRIDTLYGVKCIYPELVIRQISTLR